MITQITHKGTVFNSAFSAIKFKPLLKPLFTFDNDTCLFDIQTLAFITESCDSSHVHTFFLMFGS